MTDGTLSQNEIDDLLKTAGMNEPLNDTPAVQTSEAVVSPQDIDDFYEFLKETMKKVSITLGILLGGKNLEIKNFSKSYGQVSSIRQKFYKEGLYVKEIVKGDIAGSIYFIYNIDIARYFADLLLGGNGQNPSATLNEAHIAAARELTDQVFPALINDISEKYTKKLDIDPTNVKYYKLGEEQEFDTIKGNILKVDFQFDMENGSKVGDGCLVFDENIVKGLLAKQERLITQPAPSAFRTNQQFAQPVPEQASVQTTPSGQSVRPVALAPLQRGQVQGAFGNINLLLDVPMEITVELGRTHKLVKDILSLSQGSIIELDKMAGEAVDLLVNGKLIAHGEVVVVGEENFGVRLTEIVSPYERLNTMK